MTLEEARTTLDALNDALLSGEKSVRIGERMVTYQDTSQMQTARDRLARDIAKRDGRASLTITTWGGAKP